MPKVLILTGDAGESLEVLYPYERLTEEGYIEHFFSDAKPVAQLCHASQALAAAGVLRGRKTAAYPALEPDVVAAGAEFVDGAAVIDGQMVSARAWPDHPSWMREFVRMLREHAPVERVEEPVGV